ncbi:hypothetical protein FRC12_022242 [Ceratobasidium sp. 428]|nr:hypothetical protein FRC12_022242 [Ceratobasidium sp. 428]
MLHLSALTNHHNTLLASQPDAPPNVISPALESRPRVRIGDYNSITEIVALLVEHGCNDLRLSLDAKSCTARWKGELSDVYSGKLSPNGAPVAIKTTRPTYEQDQTSLKLAARELHIWSKCSHSNVHELLGLAIYDHQLGMVSSFIENGDMKNYIAQNPNVDRYHLSVNLAEGLAYLHNIGIVHGDLKAVNVLVSGQGMPMMIDFGKADMRGCLIDFDVVLDDTYSLRWAAPELLEYEDDTTCSTAADVYALGMTVLEIFTEQIPFHSIQSDVVVLKEVLVSRNIPPRPGHDILPHSGRGDELWELLRRCWANISADRPEISEVLAVLRSVKLAVAS